MITEAVAPRTPAARATGCKAYGDNSALRGGMAKLRLAYMLAVSYTPPHPGVARRLTVAARRSHRPSLPPGA